MSYMYNEAAKRNEELKREFPNLTTKQIWIMLNIARNAQRYCRSGKAMDNYFNSAFNDLATLTRVPKTSYTGKAYQGVRITTNDDQSIEDQDHV